MEINALQENLIQPINRETVHRICSGQVVLSLSIAVKELIENSIDAGATIIDIHLKEYGSQLIEVSDNGSGVKNENFEALTLKHYTSKIQKFNDLETIATLGFRGEALSSLCALSDLVVVTKHSSTDIATKICYDRNGKISSQSMAARQQGTTVTLENLFSTLPVRRKEFLKNLKREFNKMCQFLYAYCLVSKGIKFTCTNTTKMGSKNTVVATEGKASVRENIITVFGARQISSLVEVELIRPEESVLTEYGLNIVAGEEIPFEFEFLISSVVHGSGRSSSDRQFYFINSRPCEPTKVIKLVNEIYKQFNSHQYPFVYLNITTKTSLVDVNVTPDKRQIFLEKEKLLLATVKTSLNEIFKTFPSTFKMQNMDISKSFLKNNSGQNDNRGIKRNISETGIKKGSILETFKKRSKSEESTKISKLTGFLIHKNDEISAEKSATEALDNLIDIACKLSKDDNTDNIIDASDEDDEILSPSPEKSYKSESELQKENLLKNITITKENVKDFQLPDIKIEKLIEEDLEISIDSPIESTVCNKKSVTLDISIEHLKNKIEKMKLNKTNNDIKVKFRSTITPENNKSAEDELQKQITKDDFRTMDIIGQFNLGFIIAKLRNDLFIIDQHATDEKYNFEQLQLTTTIEHQNLVNPKLLELTAGNETILIENMEIFKKNGFNFKIDEGAPATKKVFLTGIPVSKNVVFGKDDIDEMLFMLQDSHNTMCRPSRVRAMFASRACRKSVMVGKALSKSDMRKLIDHMGEIDQPWNCPHGRPTMRHLINLDLIERDQ